MSFLIKRKVNVCEHTVKTVLRELQLSTTRMGVRQNKERSGEDGWKIEWKLSEVNTRAVSRRQNELIGKFKMATGDVIIIIIIIIIRSSSSIPTVIKRELVRFGMDFDQKW